MNIDAMNIDAMNIDAMNIDDINIDDLEATAETADWLQKTHPSVRTVGQLTRSFDPGDQALPEDVSEDLIYALGYYVWYRQRHGRYPGER